MQCKKTSATEGEWSRMRSTMTTVAIPLSRSHAKSSAFIGRRRTSWAAVCMAGELREAVWRFPFGSLPAILVAAAMSCASVPADAQCVSLTTSGLAVTQNFDALANVAGSTTNSLTLPGWFMTESGGGARDNEQYAVDAGVSNVGDTYSYGSAGAAERALGSLRSGTLIPLFGACFTNNTGSTIDSIDVAYAGEQWRLGTAGRSDHLNFEYSTNATSLTTGAWSGVAALDFVTPDTVTIGAKNGNDVAHRVSLASTISSLAVANGASIWIRWIDIDASGADDGLAVDDFSLTPHTSLPPSLSIDDVSANEGDSGATTFTFTVSLSSPAPAGGVSFDIATADGTAAAGIDYIARSLSGQTIPAGSSTYTFNVTVNGDMAVEANEVFFVNVTNIVGAIAVDAQGTGTILNDDVPPPQPGTLQFTSATYSVAESGGSVTITVSRTGGGDGIVSVQYATANGTALAGSDYVAASGTLTWANGDTADKTFVVAIIDDVLVEPNETVLLALSNVAGGATLGTANATLTIVDNDVPAPVAAAAIPTLEPEGLLLLSLLVMVLGAGRSRNGPRMDKIRD